MEAKECDAQFLLYGGAKGGGKSYWLCQWAFKQLAKFKGNKGYLGRKRSVDFTNTTLETWKKAINGKLYKINEQKKKIYVPLFDGVIDYGGMDDQDSINKFNSAEYGFIGIDQAEETTRDDFSMLRGTLRHKLKGGGEPDYQVRFTANPAQCWLKDDFITAPRDGFRFIKALPSDNPFLPADYINNKPFEGSLTQYRWAGVNWIVHPNLPGAGTAAEKCFMYHRTAIGHAVNTGDMQSVIGYEEKQDLSYARCSAYLGSQILQAVTKQRHFTKVPELLDVDNSCGHRIRAGSAE